MARQIERDGVIEVYTGGEDDTHENRTEHDRAAQDLIDHLGELGEGYTVTVHRVPNGNNQSEEFCFRVTADKFDPSGLVVHISETYGPGDYRVRVWENGKKGARQNKLITVAKPSTVSVPVVAQGNGDLAGVLNTLIAMQAAQAKETREMIAALHGDKKDPRAEMAATLALMKDMREAMGLGTPGGAVATVPQADPITSLVATLTGLAKLKGLAGEMGFITGEAKEVADSGISLEGVLNNILPKGLDLMKRHQDLEAAKLNATVLAGSGGQPAARPAVVLSDASSQLPPDAVKLLTTLQSMAAQDAEVEPIAAQLMADSRSRPFMDMLISAPNPFKTFVGYWPAALDFTDWWLDLLTEAARLTTTPGSVDNAGNNHANNGAANVSDDAGGNS